MAQYLEQISQAVVKGDQNTTIEFVQAAVDAQVDTNTIMQKRLFPAISAIGQLYQDRDYIVPEILISARAMRAGLKIVKSKLTDTP